MSCIEPTHALNNFNHIFTVNVNNQSVPLDINLLLLTQYLQSAINKFISITGDLPTDIKIQINDIVDKTALATRQIIMIIALSLFILLILLIMMIFAAIYWRHCDYAIESAFILALFFIIVIGIIVYSLTLSIYTTSMNDINVFISHMNEYLLLVHSAILPTLCAFGNDL